MSSFTNGVETEFGHTHPLMGGMGGNMDGGMDGEDDSDDDDLPDFG